MQKMKSPTLKASIEIQEATAHSTSMTACVAREFCKTTLEAKSQLECAYERFL